MKITDGELIPAVVQDAITRRVLMVGYMNQEALSETQRTGKVTFFSRSKNRLWVKGETSGNYLTLKDIKEDCDNDALLLLAVPAGPTCHTGSDTCFGEKNAKGGADFLNALTEIIEKRATADPSESYTATILGKGVAKVAQKVGEEAVELVIEAMRDERNLFLEEASDLLFHFLVLLKAKKVSLSEITQVLEARNR